MITDIVNLTTKINHHTRIIQYIALYPVLIGLVFVVVVVKCCEFRESNPGFYAYLASTLFPPVPYALKYQFLKL